MGLGGGLCQNLLAGVASIIISPLPFIIASEERVGFSPRQRRNLQAVFGIRCLEFVGILLVASGKQDGLNHDLPSPATLKTASFVGSSLLLFCALLVEFIMRLLPNGHHAAPGRIMREPLINHPQNRDRPNFIRSHTAIAPSASGIPNAREENEQVGRT
eukprot:GHVT01023751.1.p1 GENE.GHVT01023751.1~~GHVT01023751.1.p1  ORF type:complete len:159 (+),score=9.02 GHVT01023751.1:951-1427(+)